MQLKRRNFLGAIAGGATCLAAPRAFATARIAERPPLLEQAMAALDSHGSQAMKRDLVGIVDFAAYSSTRRFQIADIANGRIVGDYLVAHGKGSDPHHTGWVKYLSDRPGSNSSSRGSFVTGQAYYGKHGRSRRLHGLDACNGHAFDRAIVLHGADYVSPALISSYGKIGRSLGCFAVEQGVRDEVLDLLGPGRLLFATGN